MTDAAAAPIIPWTIAVALDEGTAAFVMAAMEAADGPDTEPGRSAWIASLNRLRVVLSQLTTLRDLGPPDHQNQHVAVWVREDEGHIYGRADHDLVSTGVVGRDHVDGLSRRDVLKIAEEYFGVTNP